MARQLDQKRLCSAPQGRIIASTAVISFVPVEAGLLTGRLAPQLAGSILISVAIRKLWVIQGPLMLFPLFIDEHLR